MKDSCRGCMYHHINTNAKDEILGECRKHPPVVKEQSIVAKWPLVNLDTGYCWEHKANDAV